MKKILFTTVLSTFLLSPAAFAAKPPKLCDSCAIVQSVKQETRKGEGGAIGVVGGAVAGGLIGSQIGGGSGKKIATAGGAVGGALLGNEVQKRMTTKTVWVTTVKHKDGTIQRYEQEAKPTWYSGQTVQIEGGQLQR